MGTWKRPLPEGVVCEDSRLEFNPKLGAGKAETAKPEVAVEAEEKPAKGKKAKEEASPVVPESQEAFESVSPEVVPDTVEAE